MFMMEHDTAHRLKRGSLATSYNSCSYETISTPPVPVLVPVLVPVPVPVLKCDSLVTSRNSRSGLKLSPPPCTCACTCA